MLSFFPRDVLDEIWDLMESVSWGFPTYSFMILTVKENNSGLCGVSMTGNSISQNFSGISP